MLTDVTISRLRPGDRSVEDYMRLRASLWELTEEDNRGEVEKILADEEDWAVFLAWLPEKRSIGFLEAYLRDIAEGAVSSPVGYIEGWYVDEDYRCQGVGARLVTAAEEWARSRGCTEMASDAQIDNVGAIRAHHQLGYQETDRIVCFLKKL